MGIIVTKQPYVTLPKEDTIYKDGISYKDGMCTVPLEKEPYRDDDTKFGASKGNRWAVGADVC